MSFLDAKGLTHAMERTAGSLAINISDDCDEPILHVTHDAHNHGWQFAGLTYSGHEKAKIISLAEMVQTDSSLFELSKLPVGWHAWRHAVEEPWIREPGDDSTTTI